MRSSFWPLASFGCCLLPFLAYGQSGMLRVQSIDVGEYKATIVIVNDSPKDVTHYSVSIDDISKSGKKGHSRYEADSGPTQTPALTWLKPGQTVERVENFNTAGSDPTANVDAEVVMAIYSDGTAQAYNKEGEEALTAQTERRNSVELAFQQSVQILESVLADSSEQHPATKAAAETREYLLQASLSRSNHGIPALNNAGKPDPAYISDLPAMLAVPAGSDEREHVLLVLAEKAESC